ncbi:MAG: 2-hydroxyacid dehydrogenase [Burkholderiaceae bacterium]
MSKSAVLGMPKLPIEAIRLLEKKFIVHLMPAHESKKIPDEWTPHIRAIATPGRDPGIGKLDSIVFNQLPRLEIISSFSSGLDGIDVDAAMNRGIAVGHAPDVLAEPVADIALGLAIDLARGITKGNHYVKQGLWSKHGPTPLAISLSGKVAGIVGLGRIGKALADRLRACGLTVCYTGRKQQPHISLEYFQSLIELASKSDFLFCCCPATTQTNNIINSDVLNALGPTGFLVNVARGSVVNEEDLISALQTGAILGAGLDVCNNEPHPDQRFLNLTNLLILPHLGASTVEARNSMFEVMFDNLERHFSGQAMRFPFCKS